MADEKKADVKKAEAKKTVKKTSKRKSRMSFRDFGSTLSLARVS